MKIWWNCFNCPALPQVVSANLFRYSCIYIYKIQEHFCSLAVNQVVVYTSKSNWLNVLYSLCDDWWQSSQHVLKIRITDNCANCRLHIRFMHLLMYKYLVKLILTKFHNYIKPVKQKLNCVTMFTTGVTFCLYGVKMRAHSYKKKIFFVRSTFCSNYFLIFAQNED